MVDGVTVLTAQAWPTNAHLIEDVAKLGYLDGRVLDVTYGYGTFWKRWQPAELVACDLERDKSPIGYPVDFRTLPFQNASFDAVVFDPPYKLNGTSRPADQSVDERYGVHEPATWQERHLLMYGGLTECFRVSRRFVLMKCMDQVVSGQKRWQTMIFANHAAEHGWTLIDRFDMLSTPRPQPERRRQVHAQSNYSTLLVFKKSP